jgi:hypothetical protein
MRTDHYGQVIGDEEDNVIRQLPYQKEERKIDKSLLYDTITCLRELDGILSNYVTDYENCVSKGNTRDVMWMNTVLKKQTESKNLLEKLRKL